MSKNLKHLIHCKESKNFSVELCSNKDLNMDLLSLMKPLFYSVTWHFKKITSINNIIENPTMTIAINLASQGKNVLMHLPCRYLSKQNVYDILLIAKQHNIQNIFALFGESIHLETQTGDFKYAADLVRYIRQHFGDYFCICVAGYPQKLARHSNSDLSIKYLKEKVDAGADFIITQVIFDTETFNKFYKSCREYNINVPIIPGIYLINSYETVMSMAEICHVVIPEQVLTEFKSMKDDNKALQLYAENIIKQLLTNESCPIKGVHLFTLNNIELAHNLTKNVSLLHK